ncbi:MAG: LL-diaminopimelate aminotransferase DapL [Lachnoclostridium sp.]
MKIEFSERANRFGSNIFNTLNEYKNQRLLEGKPVYNFSVGTPDFKPESFIMEAVSKAALEPDNYKYSLGDTPELIKAVISWYKRRYQVDLNENEIISVNGTQEGMAHIGLALLNYGDTVLVPNPGYPIFEIGPYLCGAHVEYYNLLPENNYLPDFNSIDDEVAERAKMMIVSYPANPVCATAPESFYEELIAFAKKHKIVIVHDNAYSEIVYDGGAGTSFLSFPGAKEVGVEFNSLSKTYNITGIRISFLLGNPEIVEKFKTVRSQFDYGTSYLVQKAAIAALNGPQDSIRKNRREYEKRRDALCEGLEALGLKVHKSAGSMFVWAKIPDGYKNSMDYCMELFQKTGILCTPGSSFGSLGEGYVRFALVLPVETIRSVFKNISLDGLAK